MVGSQVLVGLHPKYIVRLQYTPKSKTKKREGQICLGLIHGQNVKNWVQSTCEKLFYLTMVAEDENGNDRAGIYFKNSEASGFSKMFIVNTRYETYLTYPEDGPCCVDEVEKHYDGQGWARKIDQHEKVQVYGAEWFFCFPKQESKQSCCTIL